MKKKPYGKGKALRRLKMAFGNRMANLRNARMVSVKRWERGGKQTEEKVLATEQNGILFAINTKGYILGRIT